MSKSFGCLPEYAHLYADELEANPLNPSQPKPKPKPETTPQKPKRRPKFVPGVTPRPSKKELHDVF